MRGLEYHFFMNTKLIGSLPKYLHEKYKDFYYWVESGKSPYTLISPFCENQDCQNKERPVVGSYYEEFDEILFFCLACLKRFESYDVSFTAIDQFCNIDGCSHKWPSLVRRDGPTMAFHCLSCADKIFKGQRTKH